MITKARRGGGGVVELGFESHERTMDLSGSSSPTYWKVMLRLEPGFDPLTMA